MQTIGFGMPELLEELLLDELLEELLLDELLLEELVIVVNGVVDVAVDAGGVVPIEEMFRTLVGVGARAR